MKQQTNIKRLQTCSEIPTRLDTILFVLFKDEFLIAAIEPQPGKNRGMHRSPADSEAVHANTFSYVAMLAELICSVVACLQLLQVGPVSWMKAFNSSRGLNCSFKSFRLNQPDLWLLHSTSDSSEDCRYTGGKGDEGRQVRTAAERVRRPEQTYDNNRGALEESEVEGACLVM